MKIEFRHSFVKDLKKIDAPVKKQVKELIEQAEKASNLASLENVKRLKGADHYYRIRIGDYRVGIILQGKMLIFVRFLHRKDIYRYFP